MARIRLTLSVADSHLDRLDAVAKGVKAAGMVVERKLPDLGVLTGSIEAERLAGLHQVPGVANVEAERTVGINPPPRRAS